MTAVALSRPTLVWLLLVGVTVLSWGMGHGVGFGDADLAGAAILVVTFVKVRLVGHDFMELRDAPRWMQAAADGWLVVITATLVARLLIG